jgi:acyl dehydratase
MRDPRGYGGVAWNPATASENRIHSDEVARKYGFRGGLVPGVTVYAWLVEPAIRVWGLDWLARGEASVVLRKPVYDGSEIRVDVERELVGTHYRNESPTFVCRVRDANDILCAEGRVALQPTLDDLPERRGDPPAPAPDARPDAARRVLEELRESGLGTFEGVWKGEGENARYRRDLEDMPDLVRPDRAGWAHPGFGLGLANWVLSANVRLGPWIHVESRVRHHAPLAFGTEVVVEAQVADLFERGGHEFVDLDVAVYGKADIPILSAFHRAIYVLREA